MKTLLVIVSIALGCTMTSVGQNYMGLKQSKVLKDLGKPDSLGADFIVYTKIDEDGTNTYYFDNEGNCNGFEINRTKHYLDEYQRMLKKEFNKACENRYVKRTKKLNYLAELTLMNDKFRITIHNVASELICPEKLAMAMN